MKAIVPVLALTLLAAGCSDIPRDVEGTLREVRERKSFKVGIIAGTGDPEGAGRQLVDRVAAAAGAEARFREGAAEPLLTKLEEGDLDLVIGAMAEKSPWSRKVHFLPSLAKRLPPAPALVAMARNGENAWISLLHREAERVGGGS